ncbi:beta-glucuronidase-like isoform X2 [Chrysoperla carnea]|uniref:beta-glucuronidase-like isoform X2 n=1 Tax=Chrysoperla carnea TaxID=189513 RepID=UPI001D0694D7|nr:beta-glucuronidase-like isoform X2 [Chrysoperla carnea]
MLIRKLCRENGIFIIGFLITTAIQQTKPLLYPRDSETRDHRSLDGIWNFVLAPEADPKRGIHEFWQLQDLKFFDNVIKMPVPSSYNDITQDRKVRDHVGPVWYDRTFYVPSTWNHSDIRIWLRFGSVHYNAKVWVNGELAITHEIGHLPFENDITQFLQIGGNNRITVEVDNELNRFSIPQGDVSNVSTDYGVFLQQTYTFDFFNYAGIHRPVVLYTTPRIYIDDISINTYIYLGKAFIDFVVHTAGYYEDETPPFCQVKLLDKSDSHVGFTYNTSGNDSCKGQLVVDHPILWWPYLMHPNPGYMYKLEVLLIDLEGNNDIEPTPIDIYRLPFGIRTIRWTNKSFLINEKPVYLRGFGRHEDSDIRGKGLDLPLIAKDYNLIKWIGANTYRTSHYPYAEEIMDFADETGIMIIDECPSVDTVNYSPSLLAKHQRSLTELIQRDKNRPSVIAWSIANEPRTHLVAADEYFGAVANHVRSLDVTRPVTIALARHYNEDKAGKHLDIISFNRYNGWYSNAGRIDLIIDNVIREATAWHKKYNKPVLMSEYGADTLNGLHLSPGFVWSEEYQVELMSRHFEAFDVLRKAGFFIGEFIWNFADFKTAQSYTRVGGNRKGLFTRDRQPKASAHHLRRRYFVLANVLDNATLPDDLFPYITVRDEL